MSVCYLRFDTQKRSKGTCVATRKSVKDSNAL